MACGSMPLECLEEVAVNLAMGRSQACVPCGEGKGTAGQPDADWRCSARPLGYAQHPVARNDPPRFGSGTSARSRRLG